MKEDEKEEELSVRTWQTGLIIDSMAFSLTQFLRNLITLGILVVRWHQPMHY